MHCSPSGSSVHGILQTRMLEWVAISSPRESSQPRDQTQVSCIEGRFFTTWTMKRAYYFQREVQMCSLTPHVLLFPAYLCNRNIIFTSDLPNNYKNWSNFYPDRNIYSHEFAYHCSNANSSTKYALTLLYRGHPQRTSLPLLFGNSLQYL